MTFKRGLFFFFLWLMTLVVAGAARANYDPSDDLMNLFGGRCESVSGPLTSLAASQSGALKEIVEQMMNDPTCKGMTGSLAALKGLDFDSISQQANAELGITRLRDQAHDLELALASELARPIAEQDDSYASYISLLRTQLSSTRLELLKERSRPAQVASARHNDAYQAVQSLALSLFSQLEANPKCASRYPALGAQVGGQIVAVSSFFASAALAPVLLAAGNVIERYVSYLRNRPLAREYKKLVDSRMSMAMSCALEGLSSTFCQARDVEKVVRANALSQQMTDPSCRPPVQNGWEGVSLVGIDLPAFSDWMTRVAAGSQAVSPSQGQEKKEAQELLSLASKFKYDIDGAISKADSKIRSGGSDSSREVRETLVSTLEQFAWNYGSLTSPSFRDDPSCGRFIYFYTGGKSNKCSYNGPDRGNMSCKQCLLSDNTISDKEPTSIGGMRDAATKLHSEAVRRANDEASLSIESNATLVLGQVDRMGRNDRKPMEFLKGAQTYLAYLGEKEQFKAGRSADMLKDLQRRVDCSIALIERKPTEPGVNCGDVPKPDPAASDTPEQANASAGKELTYLYSLLSPSRDLYYVANSLYELVLQDLDQRRRDGGVDGELAVILQLSNSDSLGELLSQFGNPDATRAQAIAARGSTTKSLSTFGTLFADPLVQSIRNYKKEGSELLGLSCMQALLVPDGPKLGKHDISKECSGTEWSSLYDGNVLRFDEWKGKSFEQRACSIYDFYRKSKLKQRALRDRQIRRNANEVTPPTNLPPAGGH